MKFFKENKICTTLFKLQSLCAYFNFVSTVVSQCKINAIRTEVPKLFKEENFENFFLIEEIYFFVPFAKNCRFQRNKNKSLKAHNGKANKYRRNGVF